MNLQNMHKTTLKTARNVTVAVSLAALTTISSGPAWSQIVLNCLQPFYVGQHAACSNGTLVINPDGTTNLSGCLITETAIQAGQCTLSTGGVPPTRNVFVEFSRQSIFIDAGGPQAEVDNFRMTHAASPTPAAQFTFTPTEVSNTITLNIGGRLNFSDGQSIGTYTGNVQITATLL